MNIKTTFIVILLIAACFFQNKIWANENDSISQNSNNAYARFTAGAKSSKGMFNVFSKGDQLFIEIPDSLLGRDMLFGSRVSEISDNSKISAGQRRTNPVLISFSRRNKVLYMHKPTGSAVAKPNDLVAVSLNKNNLSPVQYSFDIVARNAANNASLIDLSKFFATEVDLVFPAGIGNTGRIDTKASGIRSAKAFAKNVEISTHYNYSGGRDPFAVTINYSFVLLNKIPMRPRLNDDRINYSSESKRYFESEKPSVTHKFIDRWDIRARPQDIEKHKRGEMVQPEKQIVFYVDTVMPAKWRTYVHEGIQLWNKAFEKIGFKNVIASYDFPRTKDFDPNDSRFNSFRYVASTDANAQGPQWIDPRTCEIVQGDIIWWHNVFDLLQTWRFIQTAAADPEARAKVLSDEIMGDAIRYAVAHEMGHVLGLQHNMRASFAYPTDSLRSPTFTQKYGTTASIMDYARNNYVAQPGDKERGVSLTPPLLGPFDYFAIEYAYKPIYEVDNFVDELPILNQWFLAKGNDPMYYNSGTTVSPVVPDPAAQADMIGDDLLKSSSYAVQNLKFITKNLVEWTLEPGDDFSLLKKRFDAIQRMYFRMSNLPLSNLGGVYAYNGTWGQHAAMNVPVDKHTQQQTVKFVIERLFDYEWLLQRNIVNYLGASTDEILKQQSAAIGHMLGNFVLQRLMTNVALFEKDAYTLNQYFADLDRQMWKQSRKKHLSEFERHAQLAYIEQMCTLVGTYTTSKSETKSASETLIAAAAMSQLLKTQKKIRYFAKSHNHKGHYKLMLKKINDTIKY